MDLKQIRYLCAVADAGSFSAGARRAFVTQPTLSAAIAALEAELGIRLFERRARGAVLTREGREALDHARAVLRHAEQLKAARRDAVTPKPLKLGLLPTLPPAFVAGTLRRLRDLAPEQAWVAEDAAEDVLRRRLSSGRYDAILTVLGGGKGVARTPLAGDRLALAVRKGRQPRGRITPAILQGQPLIVRIHCEFLQAASRILDDWQVQPDIVARTDSDSRALEMVAAGLGACLMPDSFRHDGVVFLRPEGVTLPRRLGLEWVRDAKDGRLGLFEAMAEG